jgi:energy-coupling factor transporter ATP-binding protein EcfA2
VRDHEYERRYLTVGSVFTPGSPINERDLFAGRLEQFQKILDAVSQRGYHAVLYGERGVGKTSLANVVSGFLAERAPSFVVPRVNCDAGDTFSSLWKKAFQDIVISKTQPGMGFGASDRESNQAVVDDLPQDISPDDIRRTLETLAVGITLLMVFDEFDRLQNRGTAALMSDTIKSLSDYAVNASILLIGVADSVDELIEEHRSIERALVQIPMPRMSQDEIVQIVKNGLARLEMTIDDSALEELASLSQGLPYITHLLGLHSVRAALADRTWNVETSHVEVGIKKSLEQWQQSIKVSYYEATRSPQPGNIYKEVLLGCALAEVDDLGYFTAAAVRTPLRVITGRQYDIPNFARHLKEFSQPGRGGMLERVGETRRLRYRFVSPIMRPYVVMRGFSEGLLTRQAMKKIADL